MDHALPMQVRLAVVKLRDEGRTYEEIATLLGIGRASVSRLLRRRRETGSLDRFPRSGGWESRIQGRIADLLCRIVEEMNDATLDELTAALSKSSGLETSRSGVVRAMARLGFTRKKSHWSRPSAIRPITAVVARSSARSSPRSTCRGSSSSTSRSARLGCAGRTHGRFAASELVGRSRFDRGKLSP